MKAIILAAGQNSRILNIASGLPKTLIKIGSNEILKIILNNLVDIKKINEVIIVVGYKKQLIKNRFKYSYKNLKIKYISNDKYKTTNSMYSLWLTKKFIKNEMLIINGDTIFSNNFLKDFTNFNANSLIYLDGNTRILNKESLKVFVSNKLYAKKIGKNVEKSNKTYGSPAIYIFKGPDLKKFFEVIETKFVLKRKNKYLVSKAVDSFAKKYQLSAFFSQKNSFWIEIDNSRDYKLAKKMFTNN
tara:strand:+ start:184 stop:915 length:732 start_codon:yes stop_codon:yes gene_type:complete